MNQSQNNYQRRDESGATRPGTSTQRRDEAPSPTCARPHFSKRTSLMGQQIRGGVGPRRAAARSSDKGKHSHGGSATSNALCLAPTRTDVLRSFPENGSATPDAKCRTPNRTDVLRSSSRLLLSSNRQPKIENDPHGRASVLASRLRPSSALFSVPSCSLWFALRLPFEIRNSKFTNALRVL